MHCLAWLVTVSWSSRGEPGQIPVWFVVAKLAAGQMDALEPTLEAAVAIARRLLLVWRAGGRRGCSGCIEGYCTKLYMTSCTKGLMLTPQRELLNIPARLLTCCQLESL